MEPPDCGYRSSLSSANILMPRPICFLFETQLMVHAFCFALDNAGKSSDARIAIMAITTNNSINVKARCVYTILLDAWQEHHLQFGFRATGFGQEPLTSPRCNRGTRVRAGTDPCRRRRGRPRTSRRDGWWPALPACRTA